MFRELRTSFALFAVLFFITGMAYPFVTLRFGQWMFHEEANGSLITRNNVVVGSHLIGQNFASDIYFHPRPSAAGNGFDAENSGGSNLAPSSTDWVKTVSERVEQIKKTMGVVEMPIDAVTASGSGLDPDISVGTALLQVSHVAQSRNLNRLLVEELVVQSTKPRSFGIFGEPRVNVLEINLALDQLSASEHKASP